MRPASRCCRRCLPCSIRRASRKPSAIVLWRRSTGFCRRAACRSSSERCWSPCWARRFCIISPSTSIPSICAVQQTESISTLLDLGTDPRIGINSINVVTPSLDAANAAAERLAKLPQVRSATTLQNFVPQDQAEEACRDPRPRRRHRPDPAAAGRNAAVRRGKRRRAQRPCRSARPDRRRRERAGRGCREATLAADRESLAEATPAQRAKAQAAFIVPLKIDVGGAAR